MGGRKNLFRKFNKNKKILTCMFYKYRFYNFKDKPGAHEY